MFLVAFPTLIFANTFAEALRLPRSEAAVGRTRSTVPAKQPSKRCENVSAGWPVTSRHLAEYIAQLQSVSAVQFVTRQSEKDELAGGASSHSKVGAAASVAVFLMDPVPTLVPGTAGTSTDASVLAL
jgi:hypothetical protein